MQKIIYDEVDRMLEEGVIERSNSPWSSPIVLVKKQDGSYRFCIDFRKLNELSEKDAYPLPRIESILDKLKEARYLSTLDLKAGYWQVPLSEESRPFTAFTVAGKGLFQFLVLPFGLHSAPATFQRLADTIIGPELEPDAFAYLDDLVVVSKTFEEHLKVLEEVFKRLRKANLKLNLEKCKFCRRELKYLGHVVNENGIQTDPDKIKSITEFPQPTSIKSVRSFLGLCSWYRKFVKDFSKIVRPLTTLLKKNEKWKWGEAQQRAFESLKERLVMAPALGCPNFEIPFTLQVDASNDGLGAALTQSVGGKEVVIAYASRLLSDSEKKFTVTEKECLSLVWAVRKFRPYLEGYKFVAITDHQALKWLMSLEKPSGRLARWILELQQHDFEIKYRKGILNQVADSLSRYPVEETNVVTNITSTRENTKENESGEGNSENRNKYVIQKGTHKKGWYEKMFSAVTNNPKKFPDYHIENETLFKKGKIGPFSDLNLEWKTCVPEAKRMDVLKETHDAATAGHMGIRKTIKRIKERYFWPNLTSFVRSYVRSCIVCQKHKVEQVKAPGKMFFRRQQGPWHTVTADLMGPLPRSKLGNRFLLVIQDTYTKWVELSPIKTATAAQVTKKFQELILLRYGAPETVITDNGTQFTSNSWKKLLDTWGVNHQLTPPYSPQGNPVERTNRVLKTMISQYLKDDHREWDCYLSEFRYALNTASHDSTGFTPAMLNFGRELKVPNALHSRPREGPTLPAMDTADLHHQRIQRQRDIYAKCQENLRQAYQHQAKYYNLRRRDAKFKIGDTVLKKQHLLSTAVENFNAKLAPKFAGPFKIAGMLGANVYSLTDLKGNPCGAVHAKDLKLYIEPDHK